MWGGSSWPWSYGSWICNYLCNQCLSLLKLVVWIPLRRGVLDTTLCDKVCQWLVADRWFSPGTWVSSTNKADCHDITEILLKVALNTITLTLAVGFMMWWYLVTSSHPIWQPEPLIGWDIFNYFSNMTGHNLMKLGRVVHCMNYEVLTKCC